MLTGRWSTPLPWGGVLLVLLLGVATRDCILIASAALLAVYVARVHVEHREAQDMLRCAIHCWVVGGASLLRSGPGCLNSKPRLLSGGWAG